LHYFSKIARLLIIDFSRFFGSNFSEGLTL